MAIPLSQSASTEANAVATVVESLALSRPEVGFFLRSDGRRALALPAAADLRERISQIHGPSLARSLLALAEPVLWGLVSPLAVSFPTRRYLHVAVNGRVVEADSFAPAVAKAYADLLPKGRHPAAFLRLELGPAEVDVNVHPAKSAVRLRGGRSAYPLVVGTIRAALAQEREVGGAPPSEEGGHALTLVGQFAGRCIVAQDQFRKPHGTRVSRSHLRWHRAPGACEGINNPERARMQNGTDSLTAMRNRKILNGFEFGALLTEGSARRYRPTKAYLGSEPRLNGFLRISA
jgi:DNA mismatch repair protein MutL